MANHLPSENYNRLSKVCSEHDIVKFLELIKSNKNLNDVGIHGCFYIACINESNKKNEFIDIFLNNKKLRKDVDISNICSNMISINNFELFKKLSRLIHIEDLLSNYLNEALEDGNLEFFKHLLKEYKTEPIALHKALIKACECGQLEIIKYLFVNYDLNIHYNNDLAIRRAASNNHLNIVKYLLEDDSLKEKANPSSMDDDLSICAIMQENKELIEYLYNDYRMEESQTVKEYKKYKQELANDFS